MRTKVISRWRKAVLVAAAAASLGAPAGRAQGQEPAAPPPAAPEPPAAAQPAAGATAPDAPPPLVAPGDPPLAAPADPPLPLLPGDVARSEVKGHLLAPLENGAPGQTQDYTIRKGDTLWDLSQKFLSSPWYWPKIWSINPYIENPHWIYPGNKLKIVPGQGGAPAELQAQASAQAPEAAPPLPISPDDSDVPPPPPPGADFAVAGTDPNELLASRRAVSVAGRLGFTPPPVLTVRAGELLSEEDRRFVGTMDASFEEKGMLSNFDTGYVRFVSDEVAKVGDKLILFRSEGKIVDPTNHRTLAEQTRTLGIARVVSVSGRIATVQVEQTFVEVERGALARPWVEQTRRLVPRPNKHAIDGNIVGAPNRTLTAFGEANEVYVNRGSADGVEPGNTFLVLRQGDGLGATTRVLSSYTGGQGADDQPDENVGLLLVVDVHEHVSTAIVVRSIRELEAGERVAMRSASPAVSDAGGG